MAGENKNYWIFRVRNVHNNKCIVKNPNHCVINNIILYGWSCCDLTKPKGLDDVKSMQKEKSRQYGIAKKFTDIKNGDIVIMPFHAPNKAIAIGKIVSNQKYCQKFKKYDAANYYKIE